MNGHRRYFVDKGLFYLFSANIEFAMNIEEIGLVAGAERFNIFCVPNTARIYNVLRERMVGALGCPSVEGTISWGEETARVTELDVAIPKVRAIIHTDDGAVIETTYGGAMPLGMGAYRAIVAGIDAAEVPQATVEYKLITTPTFKTDSPRYRWLTELQCVGFGRSQAIQGLFRRVSYDVFAMN